MSSEDQGRFGSPVVLATVDSTNDYIRRFIPGRRCRLVLADAQTAGRGRYNRSWFSPPGAGLYVSYLLFPDWDVTHSPGLNLVASLAVVRALRRIGPGLQLRIKEPNDILAGGRKLCGILVELATFGSRIDWVVIGIGMNVSQTSFPSELGSATSLVLEGVATPSPAVLLNGITQELESLLQRADAGEFEALNREYLQEQT